MGPFSKPIDWWRYATGVVSRAADTAGETWTALGDANRWGSDGSVDVPLQLGSFTTGQLLRVQTVDPYSRNFAIIGNVDASKQFWNVSDFNLRLGLEVTQGVGQAALVQTFNLRAITDVDAPWYWVTDPDDVDDDGRIVKPFVINCAVLARALSARVVVLQQNAVGLEDPQTVRVTAMLSPFAAGFPI